MVKQETSTIYKRKVDRLLKEGLKLRDFIMAINKVVRVINGISENINTRRTYLQAVLFHLRQMDKRNLPIEQEYSEKITNLSREMMGIMEQNKLSEAEKDSYLSWDKIIEARDKLRDSSGVRNLKAYILLGLYTYIPPRRVKDYLMLKYTTKDVNEDVDYNYLSINGPMIDMTFNNYKGSDVKGAIDISFKPPAIYMEKLKEYIKIKDIKNGDLLFGFKSQPELSNYVKRIMERLTGRDVSVNLLRHSYITHNVGNHMSTADKNEIAELMGHSRNVQDLYRKLE